MHTLVCQSCLQPICIPTQDIHSSLLTMMWRHTSRTLSRMMHKHSLGLLSMCQVCSNVLYGQMQHKHGLLFSRNQQLSAVSMECVGENSKCSENAASSCSCLMGFIEKYPDNWKLDDHTAGCTRKVPLKCGNNGSMQMKQDKFYVINSVKLPDDAHSIDAASVRACELTCLNNCSCIAYSHNGTCWVWYNHLMNLQDNIGGSRDIISIRLDASELPNSGTKKWWIIIIIIGGGGLIVLSFGVTILYFSHRRQRYISGINHGDGALISFKYRDLQSLTRNFSERLGAGSFGSVFKGVLPDATIVAIKKLEGFHQGDKQFRADVSTIGNIHHINLIRLLGFCSKGPMRLLVYEYMPRGSLDKHFVW